MREFEFAVAGVMQRALQRGRQEGRREVILKLLKADMSVEKVSEITGLSKQEIYKFQEKSKKLLKKSL